MKNPPATPRTGLARALSKLGYCSRKEGFEIVRTGRVKVDGATRTDPEFGVHLDKASIEVDGIPISAERRVYVMLNKPRGLVTTTRDEKGRQTVFSCFAGARLPRLTAVGRLDQASEGLLLFTNDSAWANRITDPKSHLDKTYHVQIDRVADDDLLSAIQGGVVEGGDELRVKQAEILRSGGRNSWLEIVLDEGKNRHIRRLLAVLGVEVKRLLRVKIGALELGNLAKGAWRELRSDQWQSLVKAIDPAGR